MKHITFIILAICILQNIFAQKPDFDEKEMQTQFAMLNNAKSINDLKNTFIGDYFRNYTPPPPEAGSQNYIISLLPTSEGGIQTTDFFDGFGRRLQTVSKQLSPLHKDIAVKYEYEGGKVVESWLPTVLTQTSGNFVSGLEEKTKSFYNDLHPFVKQNSTAFSTKTTRAGDEWNTHFAEISVAANAGGDVKKFALSGDNLIENGYYAANELIKTTGTDEDGKSGMKFTDRNGQTVLTRRINDDGNYDTYYVYNDFGQLVWVIPPMAAEASVIDGDVLDKYGYFYKYDKYGNCIEKKLPGCAPIYMVYDKAQRLILSQDGNLHEANKWLVSKYDEYGRAVYTAILASENKREDFAEIIKNEIVTEEFTLSNSFNGIGYTCNYFPEISEILSVNYYDDYAFLGLYSGNVLQNLVFIPQSNFEQEAGTPLGLATGSRTYILDGSGAFLTSTVHYDRWGQAIQTRSQNHLGGYDAAHIKYDAFGKVTNTYKTHTSTSPQTPSGGFTERYTYEYDHAFRPTVTKYQLNGNAEIKLSHNFYDELGRLKTKNRHNSADIETFEYNIQNWLTKKTSGNFEENLDYQGSFTGTITSMSWKNTGSSAVNKYIFTYDKLNRLKSGVLDNGGFAENFEYDKNGNIEHLERYFKNTQIDDLKMDYNDNGNIGNQLKSVKDYANHNLTNLYDLKEYTGQTNEELIYDANGNLIKDLDRKILQIQYNYLNLPARTIFEDGSEIVNIYASNASKLSAYYITAFTRQIDPREKTAEVLNNIKNATGTHYCGNIEYIFDKNGTTETIKTTRIHNAEGYYEGEKWYYFRKDHLGNNREVFYVGELNLNSGELNFDGLLDGSHIRYETTTVQVTNYYPSGVPWSSGKYLSVPKYTQPYKYNG
ncbi:MAG: DUF6443 domain-containing protein, partial [Prevotellaceae bacterium]|nr:DUF6443 domain-containing protein [Prevotellaceae bacterium]